MLSASKEIGTIKWKKKQINKYDPLGVEEEYKSKR